MKKYFFFAAAAIVAASCAKTPAPVQTPDGPEAPAVEGKVAVQFGTNVVANATTKASGPISGWSEQSLYILGFARTETGKAWDTPFINNVKAVAPAANPPADPAPAPVMEGDIKVWAKTNPANEPFYYSGTTTYDFYGYYVDDAASNLDEEGNPKPTLSTDKYVLPIQINGGQDILLAQADPDYALAKAKERNGNFDTDYPGFVSQYAFSAYAARRDVHPILQFEHLLTQLQFKVESGTDFTPVTGSPQIYVDKIAITGLNTKAEFCVASGNKVELGLKGFDSVNDNKDIKDELLVLTDSYVPLDHDSHVQVPSKNVAAVEVGTPIMLFPAASFDVELYLCQAGVTQEVAPIKRTINITDIPNRPDVNGIAYGAPEYASDNLQTEFTKGYSYTITFKVYGLESVDITAELAEWKDGGSISIDTDDTPTIF